VTPEDIQRVAQVYMHNVAFAYVGDTAHVSHAAISRF